MVSICLSVICKNIESATVSCIFITMVIGFQPLGSKFQQFFPPAFHQNSYIILHLTLLHPHQKLPLPCIYSQKVPLLYI